MTIHRFELGVRLFKVSMMIHNQSRTFC
jgi:hypothetical protein